MKQIKEFLTKNITFAGLPLFSLPILATAPAPAPLGIFVPGGKLVGFVLLVIVFVFGYTFISQAEKGTKFPIRTIAGFEAIKDAVGRSVEMGRPIHYTFGYGNLWTSMAPQFTAGLGVLSYVAKLAGQYGARTIVTYGVPEAIPMAEETMREGYRSGGKPEMYKLEDVRYLTTEQFAYASAVQAIINREKAAANIMIGPFYAESLIFAETGANTGSVQIAGTARETQIPFFVLVCDYVLIGEEMFAASALATGDAATAASLGAEDVGKIISVVLILLGTGLVQLGIKLAPLLLL
jgi:hypothetical protein